MMQLNFLAAHDELMTRFPEGNAYKKKLQASQTGLVEDMKSGGACNILMTLAVGKEQSI